MRTSLTTDDPLFEQAQALVQPGVGKSKLIRVCVKAYSQRQTARRLADLGRLVPDVEAAPRMRNETSAP